MRKLSSATLGRWALVVLVLAALLALGYFDEKVRGALTRVFAGGGSTANTAPAVTAGGATLTTRSLPAMLTYGVLYIGLCVLALHLLLNNARHTRWVLLAYAGCLTLIALLLGAGRVLGLAAQLTPPARALIDAILSPLPVLLLVAVMRLAPAPSPDTPAPR